MNALETLCFISEQSSFEDDYHGPVGYKVFDKGNRLYVTFDAILQSFGILNRNSRMYDADNIWNCIQTDEQIQTYLKNNSWMGEADHPAAHIQGEELTMQRIAVPDMMKTSHYIRSPRLNGKSTLEASIQTDSGTEAGRNMAIKIIDGKIVPCFSARVLGSMDPNDVRRMVRVRKLITYDWVMYPSHREAQAKFTQPIQESVTMKDAQDFVGTILFLPQLAQIAAANSSEANMICEAFDLTMDDLVGVTATGNSVVFNENGNTIVTPLTSDKIRANTKSMISDWINQ